MTLHFLQADARRVPLADGTVHCVVTIPPYFALRDYGTAAQIGLEKTPEAYVAAMVEVFREVKRVLRDDGTLWLNVGDSYAGSWGAQSRGNTTGEGKSTLEGSSMLSARQIKAHPQFGSCTGSAKRTPGVKTKDLIGIPWMLAFALRADGWYLRSDNIWAKPNPMPESVSDRPTRAHEYVFLLTKRDRYYYDAEAIKEACASGASDLKKMAEGKARIGGKAIGHEDKLCAASARTRVGTQRSVGSPDGRNKRSVWWVGTEPCRDAHFATFPTRLISPCVLAGTSAKGVCPNCGAPWQRIVDRVRVPTRPGDGSKVHGTNSRVNVSRDVNHKSEWDGKVVGNRDPQRHVTQTVTIAWLPSCKCPAHEPVPATVFDPFGGAGTTLMVADRLGRNGVMTELNPAYIEIAKRRCAEDKVKQARPQPKRRPVKLAKGEAGLFGSL